MKREHFRLRCQIGSTAQYAVSVVLASQTLALAKHQNRLSHFNNTQTLIAAKASPTTKRRTQTRDGPIAHSVGLIEAPDAQEDGTNVAGA